MIFFIPYFFLPGDYAGPAQITKVVLVALTFSLIECMLILPSHLAHMKREQLLDIDRGWLSKIEKFRLKFASRISAKHQYWNINGRTIDDPFT